MVPCGRPTLVPALLLLALVSVVAVGGTRLSSTPVAGPDMRGCDVPDLVRYLETRGLHLHASPTWEKGSLVQSAYLTRRLTAIRPRVAAAYFSRRRSSTPQ